MRRSPKTATGGGGVNLIRVSRAPVAAVRQGEMRPRYSSLFDSGQKSIQYKTPPVGVHRFRIDRRYSAGFREFWGLRADLWDLWGSTPKKREGGKEVLCLPSHGAHWESSRPVNYQARFRLFPDRYGLYSGDAKSLEIDGFRPL